MIAEIEIPKAFGELFKPHRIKCYHGGRGGAKSESIARFLLSEGAKSPITILCAREFMASIKDSVHSVLVAIIRQYKLESFYKIKETEIVGINGTKFIFVGLRRNIENIKSIPNIKYCWVEEAETVSNHSWDVLIPTIRAEGSEILVSFNADIEDSPTYQRMVIDPPSYAYVRKVNFDENPYFPEVLELERKECEEKHPDKYRNIWLGEPKMAVEGAIYAAELQKAKDDGRIGHVPYDPRYPVSAFLDIGWADNTSICFLQIIDHEFRVIKSYQSQFQKTPHYVQKMQELGFNYNRIVLPHDADNEHANADRTWTQIYREAFPNANVIVGKRQPVELRLEATKNMLPLIRIDKENNADLLAALARYHFAIDPQTKKSTREPFHGEESNYADAFGYLCLEMKEPVKPKVHKHLNIIRRSGIPR